MEKISVVFIGLGRIASLLENDPLREKPCTHAGAVAADPDCVIAAGMDTDSDRRSLFSKTWKCPTYSDAGQMIETHNPQIAVVATQPELHELYCTMAANYAIPLIICEKPLSDTHDGARRIAQLSPRILVNHERRYSKNYIRAKEILDSREFGSLLSIKGSLAMGKNRNLRDMLWNDGTHLIDMILFLSGSAVKNVGKAWGTDLESKNGTAFLTGTLERGAEFVIEVGAGRDYVVFELECTCERGRIRIGNDGFDVWESGPSPYAKGFRALIKRPEPVHGPTGYFVNMIADAVTCVRNPSQIPRSTAADALAGIEFLNELD